MCARVLVVDDDPVNADLLGYILRAYGHDAVLTLGGEAALREADARVPELVLCDIQMPGVDGFEVVRRLRADRRFDATQLVGVTALAMVGDREKVLAAGFDGYLTKPITPETFMSDIDRFLPSGGETPSVPPHDDQVRSHLHESPLQNRTKSGYVLVVDDSEANVLLMRHLIGSLGVDVRAVRQGIDALTLARALRPRLIISDIHMPGMDGIELLELAKKDELLKDVPFILISSTAASASEERRAREAGAEGFLQRPIDPETLLEQIDRWLPVEPGR